MGCVPAAATTDPPKETFSPDADAIEDAMKPADPGAIAAVGAVAHSVFLPSGGCLEGIKIFQFFSKS